MDNISNATTVIMGLGIVFIGLICIVFLCYIMSWIIKLMRKSDSSKKSSEKQEVATAVSASKPLDIANKGEFVAAVSAAIAEDLGKDISAIRITEIKRV